MLSIFTRPAPAPPAAADTASGVDSPQLQASTSISPLCLASKDSPAIPVSLRNISSAIVSPPLPDPEREPPGAIDLYYTSGRSHALGAPLAQPHSVDDGS